jgi:hypothetical protein
MWRRMVGSLVVVALALGGCGDPASTDSAAAVDVQVQASDFILRTSLPGEAFASTDAITVTTTLTWIGPAAKATIWGSGMGPVTFGFVEIDGARRMMGGAMTADCTSKEFPRGVPVDIPLSKSGAYLGNDPQAAFYQSWFADPVLHLPAGHWQLSVSAGGYLAPCDAGARSFEAKLPPIDLLIR